MKKQNKMETEVGTPIQYLEWSNTNNYWTIQPAIIYSVEGSCVDILVLSFQNRIHRGVPHEDFKKKGENYWRHLPNKDGGQFTNIVKP